MDIKDFYLNTHMAQYKYMQLQIADMPKDVIKHRPHNTRCWMDTSTAMSKKECTAYHRPESLPSN